MDLNNLNANIRLRSVWEAVDLGFVMVQAWWQSIYVPLAIVTFGIAIPLFYFLPTDKYWLGAIIFWWLKPLYDRLVLHIISHKLFNHELSSMEALKALPSLVWNNGFFQTLTFRRFSLSRGFNLPIWQLEQLRGKPRAERQRVLHIVAHSQAVWLTIGLWFLEFILFISLFALLLLFIPSHIATEFFDGFFTKSVEYKQWLLSLNAVFYVLVVTFVHPFYIAGNFALYINRRTQLEAWDIELDFRRMNQRFKNLSQRVLPVLLISCLFVGVNLIPNISLQAAETAEILADERLPAEKSKQVIEEVMLTKNLNDKKKVMRWIKIEDEQEEEEDNSENTFLKWLAEFFKDILKPLSKFIALLFESSLWIAVIIGIGLLYYYSDRWMHLFKTSKTTEEEYEAPEIMFGMDVRPDSLPEDLIFEVRKKWQENDHRGALSLLYRGALVRLINHDKVRLKNSHTEGDVLKQASKVISDSKLAYLKTLTTQWQTIAYAHRTPDDAMQQTIQKLLDAWASQFAAKDTQQQGIEV